DRAARPLAAAGAGSAGRRPGARQGPGTPLPELRDVPAGGLAGRLAAAGERSRSQRGSRSRPDLVAGADLRPKAGARAPAGHGADPEAEAARAGRPGPDAARDRHPEAGPAARPDTA